MSPKHLRRTIGVAVSSVSLLRKRVLVLPPKHLRRVDRCPNGQRRLERGWKILSLRFPQYLAVPLLGKRKKKRTRWLISFITSAHRSVNEVPALSERLMQPTPEVTGEVNQQPTGKSSDVQAIVVSDSPEMGFHGQSSLETALSMDLGEVSPTHAEVQEDIPLEQTVGRSDKAKSTRAGSSRSLLPDRLLIRMQSKCIGINKIYILNLTVVVKLLQYSGSRFEHMDGFSLYKQFAMKSKMVNLIWVLRW